MFFFWGGREVGGCKHAETLRVILRPGIFLLFLILSDNAAQGGLPVFLLAKMCVTTSILHVCRGIIFLINRIAFTGSAKLASESMPNVRIRFEFVC